MTFAAIIKPELSKPITADTLLRAIGSDDMAKIDSRLDERGVTCRDTWLELWAGGHIKQYELLGNSTRREWSLNLPRGEQADIHAARAEYRRYICYGDLLEWARGYRLANGRSVLESDSELESAIDCILSIGDMPSEPTIEQLRQFDKRIADTLKPRAVKLMADMRYPAGVHDINAISTRHNAIKQAQDNLNRLSQVTLVCSIKPMGFLGLGEYKPCKRAGSCYRVGGEYGTSPAYIGGGSDSVVWFLKDMDDNCIARCFGSWTSSGGHIQNIYNIGKDKRAIIRAISLALGVGLMPFDRYRRALPDIYHNGDGMSWGDYTAIGDEVSDASIVEPRATCDDCCGHYDPDDGGIYVDGIGDICPCCAENYIYSQYSDEYIHADYAVYVDESNTYIHEDSDNLRISIEGTPFIVD